MIMKRSATIAKNLNIYSKTVTKNNKCKEKNKDQN